ncbi:hypothetical protein [Leptolyngbya sp. GGD]|nr:hypothetical protein [Leptolyngbya sp. GGD]MCY6490810.1 hypothetical protein [Leptolyngbya sp. GGD]
MTVSSSAVLRLQPFAAGAAQTLSQQVLHWQLSTSIYLVTV